MDAGRAESHHEAGLGWLVAPVPFIEIERPRQRTARAGVGPAHVPGQSLELRGEGCLETHIWVLSTCKWCSEPARG